MSVGLFLIVPAVVDFAGRRLSWRGKKYSLLASGTEYQKEVFTNLCIPTFYIPDSLIHCIFMQRIRFQRVIDVI